MIVPRTSLVVAVYAAAATAQVVPIASPNPESGGTFGFSISGVPDLNGDGRGDIVVGAQGEATPSNANAGRVHVYSGHNGSLIRTINPPTVQSIGTFGFSVAGIPDVNGDGRGDILIGGIWEYDTNGVLCGRAYLYSGANGLLMRAWLSPYRQEGGSFGWALAWTSDLSGDGVPDLVISAVGERSASGVFGAGKVHVYSGASGVWLRTLNSPNPEQGGNFGFAVAGVPDADGDGRGDIIVGAPNEDPGATPTDAGRAYLFSGATGALIRAMGSPYPQVSGLYGTSVAGLADINGDGRGDVAVGGPWETAPGKPSRSGAVHIYSGGTGFGLRHIVPPSPSVQGYFGICLSTAPDMNGDGKQELILSAQRETAAVQECGRAYIYSPSTGVLLRTLNSASPKFQGQFGSWVAGVPDTNGDGRGDAAVGAAFENAPGTSTNSGRAYLFR